MAYDEYLEERISMVLKSKGIVAADKKMFGGFAFMIDHKMCVGVMKNNLMARIDPEIYVESIKKEGCHPMEFTGRPMKGFVLIEPSAIDLDEDLEYWVQLALDFNPKAKASKKR